MRGKGSIHGAMSRSKPVSNVQVSKQATIRSKKKLKKLSTREVETSAPIKKPLKSGRAIVVGIIRSQMGKIRQCKSLGRNYCLKIRGIVNYVVTNMLL